MEKKPKTLILTTEEDVRCVRKGFYPEYNHIIQTNELGLVSLNEVLQNPKMWNLDKLDKKEAVYVLNPFSQQYIRIDDNNVSSETFISEKAIATKRALLMMGAHCVLHEEIVKDISNMDVSGGVQGKKGNKSANIEGKYSSRESVNLTTKLYTLNMKNMPSELKTVEDYLNEKELMNDGCLHDWFETFKRDGFLTGSDVITIDFTKELNSALAIAAGINYGPIGGELKVDVTKSSLHQFSQTIRVYFDDVPDDVQSYFNKIKK